MGTKPRVKEQKNTEADGDPAAKVDRKKKKRWLSRLMRKRRLTSLSEERLHDIDADSHTDEHEPRPDIDMEAEKLHQQQQTGGAFDDIVIEGVSQDESDSENDEVDGKVNGGREGSKSSSEEKRNPFSSAFKFLKHSLMSKKRRKQTDYAKFSESTDDLSNEQPSTSKDVIGVERLQDSKDSSCCTDRSVKGKTNSKKYARFETDNDEDENKENIAMTIDDENVIADDKTTQSTSTPKKKKKSARKRVAKAGKKTGRVLGVGMVQLGKNLQYMSPMPTAHVFTDSSSKKKTSYSTPKSRKPKKPTYKYTASAPPPGNLYAFV